MNAFDKFEAYMGGPEPVQEQPRQQIIASNRQGWSQEKFEAWLSNHGLEFRPPVSDDRGIKYVLKACPFDPSHQEPDSAVWWSPSGLGFKCLHNSCSGNDWKAIRELKEPGYRDQQQQQQRQHNTSARTDAALPELVSAAELFIGNVKTLRPLLEEMMWDGLTMLIARPKAGKSWLALQIAIDVAGGREVEGIRALDHGPVLYLALEEPSARTMARIRKVSSSGPWAQNLHFVYDLMPLMGGGAEQLAALIEKLRPRLVVIDTLTAILKGGGGKRENDVFRSQYAEVSRLRKMAEQFAIPILVIHHERKGASDGVIASVAGTGGIAAAVDLLWQLKRKADGEGTLEIVGREVEDKNLAVQFGQDPFGWSVLGDADILLMSADRKQVLEVLREDGGLTPAQIAVEIGKSRPATRMLLKRMRDDGQIRKQGSKYIPSLSLCYSVTEREKEIA